MTRRTALFHSHSQTGAQFVDYNGWQMPVRFTSVREEASHVVDAAGVADLSCIGKFDLKGRGVPSLNPPAGSQSWLLGRNHNLLTCLPADRERVLASIESAPDIYTTDVTSAYAGFLVAGPRSRDILRKLTSLNVSALSNLACGQASLAHAHAIVLREDLGALPAFHLLVSRYYGESVWEAILHAGQEFGLEPFGLEAWQELGGRG